jgi:ABC-type amino acid transport system permease subunit
MDPVQAPVTETPVPVPTPTPQPTSTNPGKVLTIVAFVLSLLNGGIISLVLGIVGLLKSKKSGNKYGLAIAAIVISGVDILIITPIVFALIFFSYAGVTLRADELNACAHQDNTGQVIVSGDTYICGSTN